MKPAVDTSSLEAMHPDQRVRLEQMLLARRKAAPVQREIPLRRDRGPCALSFAQSRLWLVEQISPMAGSYNITQAYRVRGLLNCEAARAAFDAVLARHEALRTRFRMCSGVPQQVVAPHRPFALEILDLRSCAEGARELDHFMQRIARDAFDLCGGRHAAGRPGTAGRRRSGCSPSPCTTSRRTAGRWA